ncbi:hypothetical protein CGGC5_v012564 [Colletotrichum fructicola Nara gc5]|uniref:Uncharacterized protein n=1 Tax=Colletotrichum fructicola (strain Nara gc5) TaxID=1213859 RepID=A0A7J6IQL8_COLFN|nr:hypothetical protein CGGC5_v012564 [Colletotrichum fructicola Nara gc5]
MPSLLTSGSFGSSRAGLQSLIQTLEGRLGPTLTTLVSGTETLLPLNVAAAISSVVVVPLTWCTIYASRLVFIVAVRERRLQIGGAVCRPACMVEEFFWSGSTP